MDRDREDDDRERRQSHSRRASQAKTPIVEQSGFGDDAEARRMSRLTASREGPPLQVDTGSSRRGSGSGYYAAGRRSSYHERMSPESSRSERSGSRRELPRLHSDGDRRHGRRLSDDLRSPRGPVRSPSGRRPSMANHPALRDEDSEDLVWWEYRTDCGTTKFWEQFPPDYSVKRVLRNCPLRGVEDEDTYLLHKTEICGNGTDVAKTHEKCFDRVTDARLTDQAVPNLDGQHLVRKLTNVEVAQIYEKTQADDVTVRDAQDLRDDRFLYELNERQKENDRQVSTYKRFWPLALATVTLSTARSTLDDLSRAARSLTKHVEHSKSVLSAHTKLGVLEIERAENAERGMTLKETAIVGEAMTNLTELSDKLKSELPELHLSDMPSSFESVSRALKLAEESTRSFLQSEGNRRR